MNRRLIIRFASLLAIILFIVVSLSFTSFERKTIVCSGISVDFKEDNRFVTAETIEGIVAKKFIGLHGALLDTINTNAIEEEVEKNLWVKNAEVFKGFVANDSLPNTGCLTVHIEQEEPQLRVVHGAEGYYMNANGKQLPFSSTGTANVLVVTGTTPDSLMINSVLPFIEYINNNTFLRALIEQVHVRENSEVVMVSRLGDYTIEFGKIENVETKFRNLKAVYEQGLSKRGWNKYKQISLKFDNQVVCTLK